jgi:hypothetical protein
MHSTSPNKLKTFKQTSDRKLMATVFWDRKGVVMMELMQKATTVTSAVYCENLKKNCTGSFRTKGMQCSSMMHVIIQLLAICALLKHFNWELSEHPNHSPDLPPVYLPEELFEIIALQQ